MSSSKRTTDLRHGTIHLQQFKAHSQCSYSLDFTVSKLCGNASETTELKRFEDASWNKSNSRMFLSVYCYHRQLMAITNMHVLITYFLKSFVVFYLHK